MAGATIWKGIIHFGGTDVPVKLHSAVRDERIQFNLLHSRDRIRIRQQMVCALDKQPVPPEEQSRGFEVEKGKYVILEQTELEKAAPESDRMIMVHEFVKNAQIDPLYRDRVYYLEPDMHESGYTALAAALAELDVAGVSTWTMRKRSYYGVLQSAGKVLRLHTLRYADEVVPALSLGLKSVPLSDRELEIGAELIEKMTAPFDPRKYGNEHQKKLQHMIEKKARGEQIAIIAPRQLSPTEPDNLLQVLEASRKKAA